MYYLNVFFIFSIIGYIWERLLALFRDGHHIGLLYGPWVPLYGAGAIIIIFLNKYLKKKKFNKYSEKFIFFLATALVFTILEFTVGSLVELVSGDVLWNYSKAWFNYGKYICLEVSLSWGLVALIFNYYIYPKVRKYVDNFPEILTIAFIGAFIVDIIVKIIL